MESSYTEFKLKDKLHSQVCVLPGEGEDQEDQ